MNNLCPLHLSLQDWKRAADVCRSLSTNKLPYLESNSVFESLRNFTLYFLETVGFNKTVSSMYIRATYLLFLLIFVLFN